MNNRFQPNPFNNVFNGKPKNHRTHTHMRSSWSQTVKFVAVSLCIRHDFPHIQTNWLHCELCVKKRIHTINICVFNHYHLISIVHERSVGRSLTRYLSSESNQRTNQPANQSNTFTHDRDFAAKFAHRIVQMVWTHVYVKYLHLLFFTVSFVLSKFNATFSLIFGTPILFALAISLSLALFFLCVSFN